MKLSVADCKSSLWRNFRVNLPAVYGDWVDVRTYEFLVKDGLCSDMHSVDAMATACSLPAPAFRICY